MPFISIQINIHIISLNQNRENLNKKLEKSIPAQTNLAEVQDSPKCILLSAYKWFT